MSLDCTFKIRILANTKTTDISMVLLSSCDIFDSKNCNKYANMVSSTVLVVCICGISVKPVNNDILYKPTDDLGEVGYESIHSKCSMH